MNLSRRFFIRADMLNQYVGVPKMIPSAFSSRFSSLSISSVRFGFCVPSRCEMLSRICGSVRHSARDPIIGARRHELLTVFFDMLLVLAAMIVWFVISAAIAEVGP
jgi:hypothetical protein